MPEVVCGHKVGETLRKAGFDGIYYCASCLRQFNAKGEQLISSGPHTDRHWLNSVTGEKVPGPTEMQ